MSTAFETYFERLANEPNEQHGDVNEGGHFALLIDGLSPEKGDDVELWNDWWDMSDDTRASINNHQAAIITHDHEGFIDIQLHETNDEAKQVWADIVALDNLMMGVEPETDLIQLSFKEDPFEANRFAVMRGDQWVMACHLNCSRRGPGSLITSEDQANFMNALVDTMNASGLFDRVGQ